MKKQINYIEYKKLRKLRKDNELTLNEVATSIDITKSHLSNIETGVAANLMLSTLIKLSEFYRVDIRDLIKSSKNKLNKKG